MDSPANTVAAFYRGISFRRGGAPDWSSVKPLFLPGAKLIMTNSTGVSENRTSTIDEWEQQFVADIQRHSVLVFEEAGLDSASMTFADIANVLSVFETRLGTHGGVSVLRGLYSFQLVRDQGNWLIASLTWAFESPEHPLPSKLTLTSLAELVNASSSAPGKEPSTTP